MASTVVRVKRRVTDEPFDKFVLNCKRLKTNHDSEHEKCGTDPKAADDPPDNTKTILKFATTVSAEDDIKTHLTRLRKCDAEGMARKIRKPTSVIKKLREQFKSEAQDNRYKIVNCFRSIENDASESASSKDAGQNVTVVDVIKDDGGQPLSQSQAQDKDSDSTEAAMQTVDKFVYDLYLVHSGEQPTEWDIDNFTIKPFDDLIYQANDETLDSDIDSEDSNDEAHWRNEYPDTDDGLSIGEDDMRRAVEELNFGSDEDNLSSDDEDCNLGDDPVVHFMNESDENEYDYFKKHGQVRNHAAYYRNNRRDRQQMMAFSDDDSDIDDNPSSSSSHSSVSPLESCDED